MKRTLSRVLCLVMGGSLALTAFAGCAPEETEHFDAENRPLVLSIGALDGTFNPFFSTSATDSEIASMTQVGLMTVDADGDSVCGPNEATVALDWKETYKNAAGDVVYDSKQAATTEYEFVIKNGVRFSDGSELTIKDVLFNLYVYLDPAYMGSATIYSTKIQGLNSYRAQKEVSDDSNVNFDQQFENTAAARILALNNWLTEKDDALKDSYYSEQVQADYERTLALFEEEVTEDWAECAGTLTSYQEEYTFEHDWQVYFLNEGIISVRTEKNEQGYSVQMKDEKADGTYKYITTLDPVSGDPDAEISEHVAEIERLTTQDKLDAYKAEHPGATDEIAYAEITKQYAIEVVYDAYTINHAAVANILTYWETASNLRTALVAEARAKYFEGLTDGIPSVRGIETYQTSNFQGGKNKIALGDKHDVLKITINDVDPKAVYNFSFAVTPMAYYSNAEAIEETPYGVRVGNDVFFDTVLKGADKTGLPKGAGTYMATNSAGNQATLNKNNFYENNIVYFERNPYFYTLGLDGAGVTKAQIDAIVATGEAGNDNSKEIHNAYIKYLNYKVVSDDRIVQNLTAQNIDYGQPNAEPTNVTEVGKYEHLNYKLIETNGYGYVGINPKYVPDLEVRQAIMMAMDTSLTIDFYGENAVEIYRPVSTTSWASPNLMHLPREERFAYKLTRTHTDIVELVGKAGWYKNADGILEKNGKTLKLKFTIAGESKNHPAYRMFDNAATFLRQCGFDISVGNDIQALKKLATGGLEVWAAAWSTGIDPDPYQTYHKDSTATSVKNWNYSEILDPNKTQFARERATVTALSELIDQGRKTTSREERKNIYAQAYGKIMDLAVELPTYQRNDLVVYNAAVINEGTLYKDYSSTAGLLYKIWQVNYN